MVRRCRTTAAFGVILLLASSPALWAGDEGIDVDLWHAGLAEAVGPEPAAEIQPWSLGIYPEIGVGIGLPNWYSGQGNVFVSLSDGKTFSIFGGYGREKGPSADSRIITVGWGGVKRLPVATTQVGFHGKFLRYRRWDEEDHGIHHGLSIGTIHGVGVGGLSFEIGAARSERNHWLITLEMTINFAVPVYIPLGKERLEQADSSP